MSYRSKKTFAARGGDAIVSENQPASASNSIRKSQPPKPPLDPTANKWGPFNPPTVRSSQPFGFLSEPIKPSKAVKNETTFALSPSMKASEPLMKQQPQVNPQGKPSNGPSNLPQKPLNKSQRSTPLTTATQQQQQQQKSTPVASQQQHRSMAQQHSTAAMEVPQQQKTFVVTSQDKETVVPHKEMQLPLKRTQEPLICPVIGNKTASGKRVAVAHMGAATTPYMPQPSPSLLDQMELDKKRIGSHNNRQCNLPFQSHLSQPPMHVNEDTQHMERSPQHLESDSWANPFLEGSSCESEDIDEAGGNNTSAKKAATSRPRCRTVVPNWPENVKFDEKEEAIAFDSDGKRHLVKGPVQPRDVWNDAQLRYYVQFNDLTQPIRKGGSILVSFLRDIARREKFCPVGEASWHKLTKKMKADVVLLVRKHFVIPDGETFDKAILKRTSKYWKNYRYSLRETHFDPVTRTKDQIYERKPDGINMHNWSRLVDYWFSSDFTKLSKLGKDARASLGHAHFSGATSFANRRVDLQEKKGEFSELDFYKSVYTKKDGSFKDGTLSRQFLEDADIKVKESLACSSSSKSKVDIENEVFNKLMYNGEVPKRPLNYGFGVKQSDIFGVQSLLRAEGSSHVSHSMVEVENLKNALATVKKQNEDLQKNNQMLETKIDETNNTFKLVASHLAQVLKEVRNGNSSAQLLDGAESAIHLIGSQIPTGESKRRVDDT